MRSVETLIAAGTMAFLYHSTLTTYLTWGLEGGSKDGHVGVRSWCVRQPDCGGCVAFMLVGVRGRQSLAETRNAHLIEEVLQYVVVDRGIEPHLARRIRHRGVHQVFSCCL